MRDPKIAVFGVLIAIAGIGCGLKAHAISNDRAAFDAAYKHKYNDFKADANGQYLTPTSDEDAKYVSEMIERGGLAGQWWTYCQVLSGVGVLVAAYGVIGKSRKQESAT